MILNFNCANNCVGIEVLSIWETDHVRIFTEQCELVFGEGGMIHGKLSVSMYSSPGSLLNEVTVKSFADRYAVHGETQQMSTGLAVSRCFYHLYFKSKQSKWTPPVLEASMNKDVSLWILTNECSSYGIVWKSKDVESD